MAVTNMCPYLYYSDQQISYTMERTFKEAFAGFAKDTLDTLGRNPALAEFPLAVSHLLQKVGIIYFNLRIHK